MPANDVIATALCQHKKSEKQRKEEEEKIRTRTRTTFFGYLTLVYVFFFGTLLASQNCLNRNEMVFRMLLH